MSALLISLLAFGAATDGSPQQTATPGDQPAAVERPVKTPIEMRQAIRETMRREALTKDETERAEAIRELASLLTEVRRDTQLTQDEKKRLHALLWSRLTRIKRELQIKIDRERREAARQARIRGARDDNQLIDAADPELAAAISQQFSLASQLAGGPGAVVARSGEAFGGRGVPDNGEVLVELIERTIAPDTWESAGGNGSIYYFYPLHCLVIRQTSEVHGHTGDLIDALRRAGP